MRGVLREGAMFCGDSSTIRTDVAAHRLATGAADSIRTPLGAE